MDKRLAFELLPAIAFLLGNAIGGLFVAAGAAGAVTGLAVVLRWHWDRQVPWLAVATFALSLVMLTAGIIFESSTFIKVRSTIGSASFALIVGVGMLARPSLLRRTLGYKLQMTDRGWQVLQVAWIAVAFTSAMANEAVWRTMSDDVWVTYSAVSGPVMFGVYWLVTRTVAIRYWNELSDTAR